VGQKRKCPGPRGTPVLPSGADVVSLPQHVGLVAILLKKSKVERVRKSREDRFLVLPTAVILRGTATKVCDRFCGNRYGPSRRRAWDVSARLKISLGSRKGIFQQYLPLAEIPSPWMSSGPDTFSGWRCADKDLKSEPETGQGIFLRLPRSSLPSFLAVLICIAANSGGCCVHCRCKTYGRSARR
jgi:hypothetical protein